MDTKVAYEKDGKPYNKYDEEIIPCQGCGNPTTMTGTKLCNFCWNAKGFFTENEIATLQHALGIYKKYVHECRVSRHWTAEDKNKNLDTISTIKQKLEAVSSETN